MTTDRGEALHSRRTGKVCVCVGGGAAQSQRATPGKSTFYIIFPISLFWFHLILLLKLQNRNNKYKLPFIIVL